MSYPGPFPFKVQQGGTGEISLTANAVLIGENASDITVTNVGTNGQVLLGATAAAPAFATLTSTGGTVSFTLGANSLNLEAGGGVAIDFDGDTGTATPSLNTITLAGGNNIATSASGSTVTFDVDGTTNNAVQIGNASGSLTSLGVGTNGQVIIGATAAAPAFATLTSTGGTITFTPGANTLNLEAASSGSTATVTFQALGSLSIVKGELVNINGWSGGMGLPIVELANASSSGDIPTIGMALTAIDAVTPGTVQISGRIDGVDTSGVSQGAVLFVSAAVDGEFVSTAPVGATNKIQAIGTCLNSDVSGSILLTMDFDFVRVPNIANDSIWVGDVSGSASETALANGVLTYNTSTNAFSGSTLTQNAMMYGGASNAITSLGVATNGQIPIGSTAAAPVLAAITAGTGISVTNGAGSITIAAASGVAITFAADSGTATPAANTITIAGGTNCTTSAAGSTVTIDATGGSSFTWNEETGTSATMAVNNGYIANNAGLVTLTLPTTAAVGDIVRVTGKGAGGWRIAQNAGETIYFGVSTTTTGATGHLDSTAQRDGVELVCVVANNDWNVLSSIGNLSVT